MRKIFIIILIVLVTHYIHAGNNSGTAGMQFLKLGADARANSMAGAVVGEVDDIDSIYWNPAGLNNLDKMMVTATYNKYIADMNFFYLGTSMPFFINKIGTIGFSVAFLDEGGLEDTGNLDSFGDLSSYDLALSGAYGLKLGSISFGGALRYIRKKIFNYSIDGAVVDIGGMIDIPQVDNLKAGMVVRNLGWASKAIEKPDGMPVMYQFGTSYTYKIAMHNIIGALSSDLPTDDDPDINIGLEYGYGIKQMIFLRTGYKYETTPNELGGMKGLSAGVGGKFKFFAVDLNWISYGELGQSIQSTLNIMF